MQVNVLGPLEVTAGRKTVDIGSEKQRRLLAALAVHAGSVVPTDRLIDVLWGEQPPASALRSLRTYVYRLREAFRSVAAGDEVIVTRPPGYVLACPGGLSEMLDSARFEHLLASARGEASDSEGRLAVLDEALGLWRGPAYAEFFDTEFARAEAIRLEELGRTAMEERFDALLALGRNSDVVGGLHGFVRQHPLRGRAREQLMLALYRSGRHADALAVCNDFREVLLEELGLDLPESVAALEVDILRGSPVLDRDDRRDRDGPGEAAAATGPSVAPTVVSLPTEPTRLVGREHDVAAVGDLVRRSRLVTITGVGGVGKSRVATRVALEASGAHPGGVWWCELARVADEGDVANAVAATIGARPGEGRTVSDAIADLLERRMALVVLDNCEHVLAAVASLARIIGDRCHEVTVLATSRAPLGVAGEQVYPLGPLAVTSPAVDDRRGDDTPGPALELLLERGRAVRPDLDDGPAERARMIELCDRLDGLPLAIELAASRLRSLNPTDLIDRLDERLDLIADTRDNQGRHRGLRAVLDWSYELLTHMERRLFSRLSVFAGVFTLEAVERVCSGAGIAEREVVDLLAGLVDHSLVAALPGGGSARYRLLETIRVYGREKLAATGEDEVRHRHGEYHVALAEAANEMVRGRDEAAGNAVLDAALDDLRSAHHWAVGQGEVDLAMRLVAAAFRYALWRGRVEMFAWAEAAARLPGAADHRLFPAVTGMIGWGAGLRGDLEAADAWAESGLAATCGPDDPRALGPLEVLMHTALWQGRLDECLGYAERASRLTDDPYELVPHYVPCLALTYAGRPAEALARLDSVQAVADRLGNPTMRALVHYCQGEALLELDPTRAGTPLEQAVTLAAEVGNHMVSGIADVSLISLRARHGDASPQAARSFVGVIDRLHGAGDWTHLWTGLRGLVTMLERAGQSEDAAVLLGAVRGAANAPPVYGEDLERLAEAERRLAEQLDRDVLVAAQARGRAMDDNVAIAVARAAIQRCADT